MRFSSQRSSSTLSIGTLEVARASPVFNRRIASSRPRRWGIETTSGADIGNILDLIELHVIAYVSKGRGACNLAARRVELSQFPFVFPRTGRPYTPVRAEEIRMSIGTIILIILVIALLGGFSGIGGGPFYGTGYYGGGGLGLVIVILLILLLLGKL